MLLIFAPRCSEKFKSSQRESLLKDTSKLSSANIFLPDLGERTRMKVIYCNVGKGNFQNSPIQIHAKDFLHTWISIDGCYRYPLPAVLTFENHSYEDVTCRYWPTVISNSVHHDMLLRTWRQTELQCSQSLFSRCSQTAVSRISLKSPLSLNVG